PRPQALLEERVDPPFGGRAEVQGRGAEAPDVTDPRQNLTDDRGLVGSAGRGVAGPRRDPRLRRLSHLGGGPPKAAPPGPPAPPPGPAAPYGRPLLAAGRIADNASDGDPVHLGRDRDRIVRQPVHEVDRAVDRVEHPPHPAVGQSVRAAVLLPPTGAVLLSKT